jgi:hypothetical protein
MDAEVARRKASALKTFLEQMEVPENRKDTSKITNIRWLSRNLSVNNRDHPMLETVNELIRYLLRNKDKTDERMES